MAFDEKATESIREKLLEVRKKAESDKGLRMELALNAGKVLTDHGIHREAQEAIAMETFEPGLCLFCSNCGFSIMSV